MLFKKQFRLLLYQAKKKISVFCELIWVVLLYEKRTEVKLSIRKQGAPNVTLSSGNRQKADRRVSVTNEFYSVCCIGNVKYKGRMYNYYLIVLFSLSGIRMKVSVIKKKCLQ